MGAQPLTLLGSGVMVGSRAPEFEVVGGDSRTVRFSSFLGKVRIILSVPSVDTPVCDRMTRRFDAEGGGLGNNVVVLTISTERPFAQKRWCKAAGVRKVQALSDHRDASLGTAFGVLIKELRLT